MGALRKQVRPALAWLISIRLHLHYLKIGCDATLVKSFWYPVNLEWFIVCKKGSGMITPVEVEVPLSINKGLDGYLFSNPL